MSSSHWLFSRAHSLGYALFLIDDNKTLGGESRHDANPYSAWMQYSDEAFERKIELFTQQLHCALGAGGGQSPLDVLERRLNLLMMHHPPGWLSRASKRRFEEEIYLPDRFLLCLHGHMHEARAQAVTISGDQVRYQFQAPSLFGLEQSSSIDIGGIGVAQTGNPSRYPIKALHTARRSRGEAMASAYEPGELRS